VLDDDDRVAHVAQPASVSSRRSLSRGCRPIDGSSRMYSTPTRPAADLTGQANPLRLAAGERRGGAVERQVVEPDVHQEPEPAADLLQSTSAAIT
jgi:hypothetical protein